MNCIFIYSCFAGRKVQQETLALLKKCAKELKKLFSAQTLEKAEVQFALELGGQTFVVQWHFLARSKLSLNAMSDN